MRILIVSDVSQKPILVVVFGFAAKIIQRLTKVRLDSNAIPNLSVVGGTGVLRGFRTPRIQNSEIGLGNGFEVVTDINPLGTIICPIDHKYI